MDPSIGERLMRGLASSPRLGAYMAGARGLATEEVLKTARERREGDDAEPLLAAYPLFLASVRVDRSITAPFGAVATFFLDLPVDARLRIVESFRALYDDAQPNMRFHNLVRVHADAFSFWLCSCADSTAGQGQKKKKNV